MLHSRYSMVLFRPNSVRPFTEEVLDLNLSQVAEYTLRHYTRVTQAANQSESRTPIGAFGLYTLHLSCTLTDHNTQHVLDFLNARRGRSQGFRVRHPADYQLTAPLYSRYEPGTGVYTCTYGKVLAEPSNTSLYRIYKITESRSLSGVVHRTEKPIFKPRPGTIRLFNGTTGAFLPTSTWLIDYSSGQILWVGGIPPVFPVGVLGEFDLPVRIEEDETRFSLDTTSNQQYRLSADIAPPAGGILAQGILCEPHVTRLTIENLSLVEYVPQDAELTFNPIAAFTGVGNFIQRVNLSFTEACNGSVLEVTWTGQPVASYAIVMVNGQVFGTLPPTGTIQLNSFPATIQVNFINANGDMFAQSQLYTTTTTACSGGGGNPPVNNMYARLIQFTDYNTSETRAGFIVSPPPPTATDLEITQAGNTTQVIPVLNGVGGYVYTQPTIGAANFTLRWLNGVTPIPNETFTTTGGYVGSTSQSGTIAASAVVTNQNNGTLIQLH